MLLTLSGRSFIKIQYSSFLLFLVAYPFRIATQLQYYVKREKCKVNDIKFPSGCEARAINLGNKNMKIGIYTGATSVRSKIFSLIFLDILPESMKQSDNLTHLICLEDGHLLKFDENAVIDHVVLKSITVTGSDSIRQ